MLRGISIILKIYNWFGNMKEKPIKLISFKTSYKCKNTMYKTFFGD